jgi:hypothetical protein
VACIDGLIVEDIAVPMTAWPRVAGQRASDAVVYVFPVCEIATASKAMRRASGNTRPRFAARRRIPAQAFGVKKYRCGTGLVSKTSDNEHTVSPLRDGTLEPVHTHVLSVQHSVGPPVPELAQCPEEGTKVPSFSTRQDAGDILPDHPLGPYAVNKSKKDEGQVATRVSHSSSQASDGKRLARSASANKVNGAGFFAGATLSPFAITTA